MAGEAEIERVIGGDHADVHRALPEDPVLVEQALDVVEQLGEARDPGADVLGEAGRQVPRRRPGGTWRACAPRTPARRTP